MCFSSSSGKFGQPRPVFLIYSCGRRRIRVSVLFSIFNFQFFDFTFISGFSGQGQFFFIPDIGPKSNYAFFPGYVLPDDLPCLE